MSFLLHGGAPGCVTPGLFFALNRSSRAARDHNYRSGCDISDCFSQVVENLLKAWQACVGRSDDDDTDSVRGNILLILKAFIGRQENVESVLGSTEQLAVLKR